MLYRQVCSPESRDSDTQSTERMDTWRIGEIAGRPSPCSVGYGGCSPTDCRLHSRPFLARRNPPHPFRVVRTLQPPPKSKQVLNSLESGVGAPEFRAGALPFLVDTPPRSSDVIAEELCWYRRTKPSCLGCGFKGLDLVANALVRPAACPFGFGGHWLIDIG